MISRRPIHMSTIMIPFETSLKGANEPIGPAKPNAGPTFPSVVAEAATAANGESSRSTRCASIEEHDRPGDEDADVEQHERDHRADHPLVDRSSC